MLYGVSYSYSPSTLLGHPAILVLTMCHYFFLSPCALFPNPKRVMYGKKLHEPYIVAACHVVEEPGVETEALVQEEQGVMRTRIEEEQHVGENENRRAAGLGQNEDRPGAARPAGTRLRGRSRSPLCQRPAPRDPSPPTLHRRTPDSSELSSDEEQPNEQQQQPQPHPPPEDSTRPGWTRSMHDWTASSPSFPTPLLNLSLRYLVRVPLQLHWGLHLRQKWRPQSKSSRGSYKAPCQVRSNPKPSFWVAL